MEERLGMVMTERERRLVSLSFEIGAPFARNSSSSSGALSL